MKTTPDFKLNGRWIQRFTIGDKYTWTVSGVLWNNIKERTTANSNTQLNEPSYIGAINSFKSFQEFAEWNMSQDGYAKGYDLDADILKDGTKEYCKEKCLLIPKELNRFLQGNARKHRKEVYLPHGVQLGPLGYQVKASLKLPSSNKRTDARHFSNIDEAKDFYMKTKNSYLSMWLDELSDMEIDQRVILKLKEMEFCYEENGLDFGWRFNCI